jgi:hypothetical protein
MKKIKFFTALAALLCATTSTWSQNANIVTVETESELRSAMQTDGANIKLKADLNLSNKTLEIAQNKTVTIDLDGHTLDRRLTKRGEGGGQVFTARKGSTFNLSNGTVKGGWGGDSGGINNEGGTVNLTNVTITGNTGDDRGGGIVNRTGSTLTMIGGAITNNKSNDKMAPEGGGGIFNYNGAKATLTNVTITGNEAKVKGGGGICNYGYLELNNCTITDNTAKMNGGAIWNGFRENFIPQLIINGVTITGNRSEDHAGGIYTYETLKMQGKVTVTGNLCNGLPQNVYLNEGASIDVTGSLAESSIGITMKKSGVFTNSYKTNNSDVAASDIFTADLEEEKVILAGEEAFLLPRNVNLSFEWEGSGTSDDPYLIQKSTEWIGLAIYVRARNNCKGLYFAMPDDVDANGYQVGSEGMPFCGTFDGYAHKLTYTKGDENAFTDEACAPFGSLNGATLRNLTVTGSIWTTNPYNGSIALCIRGEGDKQGTTLYNCRSDIDFCINHKGSVATGGLIGQVMSGVTIAPTFEKCIFNGRFRGSGTHWGGMVGWSDVSVTFRNCMFDPYGLDAGTASNSATYVRLANGVKATFEDCFCTRYFGTAQGVCGFNKITVPEGCTYEMVEEPFGYFGGMPYWKSGDHIKLTMPEGTKFNHWATPNYPGVFISDCFRMNGIHQLLDVNEPVNLTIATDNIPEASQIEWREGVKYRYLSKKDYHFYVSDELRKAKGWLFHSDDDLVIYDGDGEASHITAIVDYKQADFPSSGVIIENDLVSPLRKHSRLGIIAPRAFAGSTKLKSLYFQDTDGAFYNLYNALLGFDFMIGEEAFKDCPNLEEIKMMQYTFKGDNHWQALKPTQVFSIGDNVFDGSPKAKVSCHRSEYQNFLTSDTWKDYRNRFIIYDATVSDETVNGVKYHYYRNAEETKALTSEEKDKMLDNHLRIWNADYKEFNAADLLQTNDNATVYYTYVVGVDNDDIDKADGVMRIYNDMGSNYNYKTLALGRNAIKGNTHVKYIEFYQTNGNGDNSHSDLKMVIQNGAFAGCKNLKELRMFYYVEEGPDHWETLGPKDVIPGDNIFGWPDVEDSDVTKEQIEEAAAGINPQFKVLVSTERMQEFMSDPNWEPYQEYLEPVDFISTSSKKEYTENGLTYGYLTSPGGILQNSQVVSQDVSWFWTYHRIAIEVAIIVATTASSALNAGTVGEQLVKNVNVASANELNLNVAKSNVISQFSQRISTMGEQFAVQFDNSIFTELTTLSKSPWWQSAWNEVYGMWNYGYNELLTGMGLFTQGGDVLTGQAATDALTALNNVTATETLRSYQKVLTRLFSYITTRASNQTSLAREALDAAKAYIASRAVKLSLMTIPAATSATTTASLVSSMCWGGSGSYNGDALQKGMRENILSNIHEVSAVGGSYIITTPTKNIVYHTYIKEVDDNLKEAKIYGGFDKDGDNDTSDRTMTFARKAFQNKKKLEKVTFYANTGQTSNASMPMILTIPDSAFVGCTALKEFNTLLVDNEGGTRALGPENFVFAGDSIFAGLDPATFHIVIDPTRKQDFLDNASWAPLEKYFVYKSATPVNQFAEYGANYAYAYDMNSIKKENKVSGHRIEHTIVTGPDDEFIQGHQGAVKLCNDPGRYNNYQLDYVVPKAFYGNTHLRTVSFTDLYGFLFIGDSYSSLDITLKDSCFADCKNLANIDLVYMKTDGLNKLLPMTPQQIKIGKGVLDGTTASLKMMPQQVEWFEADTTWAKYKDRFLPCLIRLSDPAIQKALKDMSYYDPANTGVDQADWSEYCDLARIGGAGFSWLDGKFQAQHEDIRSFGEFKHFESIGLDYVGKSWFEGCSKMGNILLPDGIADIRDKAFKGCSVLKEIELPQAVATIGNEAFAGCSTLNTIRVLGDKPAKLGTNTFDKHAGLKIYVPAGKAADYKAAWSEYKDYIVDGVPAINKVVTVTETGQLADKLGLTLVEENDKVRYIQGPYTQYDSLTVSGPLNGKDLAVIRHMAGADAYDSDPTDGRLKYLNLWNAELKKDEKNSYNGNGSDEYMDEDDLVPDYLFENCEAIETVILPQSAKKLGENIFEDAKSLQRVCIGRKTTYYNTDLLQNLDGIDELVLLTEGFAEYGAWISWFFNDPWESPINVVYTTQQQIGNYMGDIKLARQSHEILAPFEDDQILWALADKGHFFPSEYLLAESVEGIFNGNTDIKKFDDFSYFGNVKALENTFNGNSSLTAITLPMSIEQISASAFSGCTSLESITVNCDSVPTLEADAFESLPADFKILVPKRLCKLYREKWAQYADHINVDQSVYSNDEILTVTVTEPNTLAKALGMEMEISWAGIGSPFYSVAKSLRGNYSHIRKLKVIGPISGADFDLLRYLAGWCPWEHCRNYAGHLEYLDLYDADIAGTWVGVQGYKRLSGSQYMEEHQTVYPVDENILPYHAFLRAYSLKTLILPKSCIRVKERALQECEGLEVLVVGDDMRDFDWNSLDDDAMLTRMYLLTKEPMDIHLGNVFVNLIANNYNPTFDAFYVRPSQYEEYLRNSDFTKDQRTNLISKGAFSEDEEFCAFASHGAATMDDLSYVNNVSGWFKDYTNIRDLTYLGYTAIQSLQTADIQPLTKVEKVMLPVTLEAVEDSLFSKAPNLRYVDMLLCTSTDIVAEMKERGFASFGIDSLQTLVYVPSTYGESDGTNIVVSDSISMKAQGFRLNDGKDYCVPYAFSTDKVENSRTLAKSDVPYTICLPYSMPIPDGAKAYRLSGRSTNELIFTETTETLQALQPYLIWTADGDASLNTAAADIPANGATTVGQQDYAPGYTLRGTLSGISNADAADMGAYTLQNDGLWHPVKSDTDEHKAARILPYRAYLLQSARANARAIGMTLEGTTGITQLRTIDHNGTVRIYDLNGRQLNAPSKGIVIRNGQKVMIK